MRGLCNVQLWAGLALLICLYTVTLMYLMDISLYDIILLSVRKYFYHKCDSQGPAKKIMWYGIGDAFSQRVTNKNFRNCRCTNCEFVFPVLDNSDITKHKLYGPFDVDAILVQASKIQHVVQPPIRKNSDQAFVFVDREPCPEATQYMTHDWRLTHFTNTFNWTITYRHDSDIFYPYGEITPATQAQIVENQQKNFENIYKKKTRNVAWVVSHCPTASKRLSFVHELQKYIDVDIYGRCGNLTILEKGSERFMDGLEFAYKFYLSFENSYETDYVTEKLFDWFEKDVIVVVRGAANYSKVVPEDTIINAADFTTPQDLAEFLIKLGNEKNRYVEYLRRKTMYTVINRKKIWQRVHCELCHMLHNVDNYRKSYSHIGKWWTQYN